MELKTVLDRILLPVILFALFFLYYTEFYQEQSELPDILSNVWAGVTSIATSILVFVRLFSFFKPEKNTVAASESETNISETVENETINDYRQKIHQLFLKAKALRHENVALSSRLIQFRIMKIALVASAIYALSCLLSALLQQSLNTLGFSRSKLEQITEFEPFLFVASYSQSISLTIAVVLIAAFAFAHIRKAYAASDLASHPRTVLVVGALPFLSVGLISFLTLTPEQLQRLYEADPIPSLNLNYVIYLLIMRLIMYPIVGMVIGLLVLSYRPRTQSHEGMNFKNQAVGIEG